MRTYLRIDMVQPGFGDSDHAVLHAKVPVDVQPVGPIGRPPVGVHAAMMLQTTVACANSNSESVCVSTTHAFDSIILTVIEPVVIGLVMVGVSNVVHSNRMLVACGTS